MSGLEKQNAPVQRGGSCWCDEPQPRERQQVRYGQFTWRNVSPPARLPPRLPPPCLPPPQLNGDVGISEAPRHRLRDDVLSQARRCCRVSDNISRIKYSSQPGLIEPRQPAPCSTPQPRSLTQWFPTSSLPVSPFDEPRQVISPYRQ